MREIENEIERVKNKIPNWFKKQNQICSQILISYLELKKEYDEIDVELLKNSCKNISDFQGNYNQMKIIAEKNHAKVFDEIDGRIFLWKPVEQFIIDEYKKNGRVMNEEKNLQSIIEIFINKWDTTDGLWRDEFIKGLNNSYKGFRLKISYGKGVRIVPRKDWFPYISLLEKGKNYKPSNGVYPYISYNTIKNKIETGLGYSRDNIPNVNQNILNEIDKYPQSIFSKNEITELVHQVNKNVEEFHKIVNNKGIEKIMNKTKNIILYGVPGVGKTYNTKKLISLLELNQSEKVIFEDLTENNLNDGLEANRLVDNIKDRVKFITFHQSFGYEDFIEGFRPDENGDIKLKDGVFKEFCKDAQKQKDKNFYFIIDEINRANISKVFGELITLIEEDKRDTLSVTLPYSKESFSIPSNLFIIGTMNSTDKSIALIDIALRRRFTFVELKPNSELVKHEKARELMEKLNDKLDSEYKIGHSYFMDIECEDALIFTCKYKIKPLLEEYFYGDNEGLEDILSVIDE